MSVVLQIVASVLGVVATWFVGKEAVKWLQAYRTNAQRSETEEAHKQMEEENRKANADSDKLKNLEGR